MLHEYSGTSDEVGQVSFPFEIPIDAVADIYEVSVLASADGYENASASTTFEVIGSGDFAFDNSTSDEFDDFSEDGSSSSDDNCCSSDDNNDDFNSPTVKSTDPSDGDNNVPTDLSEIKVTFDESIDKNSMDTGSLSVFANNCGNTFCNDPDIQDVSVSGKTATFSINSNDRLSPDTNYIASISSSIPRSKMVTFWTALTQKEWMITVNGIFQHQVVHLTLPFQLTQLLGLLLLR